MDLLAAFFFSSTILAVLNEGSGEKTSLKTLLQASGIAVSLLAVCCVGFSYIASYHGGSFNGGEEELLVAITMKLLGPYAGLIVSVAVALACLTTAIALISAFSDFAQREVFDGKAHYGSILVGTLLVTFFVSTFEFTAIASFLKPILQVSYPALIALTFLNILHRLTGFEVVKTPIALVFGCSLLQFML
jgi:LIVCS family branched-chain amino acid:cation transporter